MTTGIAMNDRALRDVHAVAYHIQPERLYTKHKQANRHENDRGRWWRTLDGALSIIRRGDRPAGVNIDHDHISDMQFHSGCEKHWGFAEMRRARVHSSLEGRS